MFIFVCLKFFIDGNIGIFVSVYLLLCLIVRV